MLQKKCVCDREAQSKVCVAFVFSSKINDGSLFTGKAWKSSGNGKGCLLCHVIGRQARCHLFFSELDQAWK